MRRIIARLLQYTITRLFMPATVPYYCLKLIYGTLYTPLYLKGNKKLDRARTAHRLFSNYVFIDNFWDGLFTI